MDTIHAFFPPQNLFIATINTLVFYSCFKSKMDPTSSPEVLADISHNATELIDPQGFLTHSQNKKVVQMGIWGLFNVLLQAI